MILTVTANPAIDKIVLLQGFKMHKLHRISGREASLTLPGGKGVNIAIGLNTLSNEVVATGFASGYTGHLLTESVRNLGISTNFVFTEGTTRTNISVLDLKNETLTEVNEVGPTISEEDQTFYLDTYQRLLQNASLVIVGGSLPKGVGDNFYSQLVYYANKANVRIIMHVAPKYLDAILIENPDVIIPDLRSKKELGGYSLTEVDSLIELGQEILQRNARIKHVILENRIENVVALSRDKRYVIRPQHLKILNMLGYADAYVAGFAHNFVQNKAFEEALIFASACGLTNVEQVSKDLNNIDLISANLSRINLEEV